MAVEGERTAGQPWCDVCLDLSQKRPNKDIDSET